MSIRFKTGLAVALAAALTLPAFAADGLFRAKNKMQVGERADGVIEVGGFPRYAGLEDYWCAAGDYLYRAKRTPWQTKIYVVRGIGPSQVTGYRDAVLFTLDPVAAGVTPLDKGINVVGTLTVGRSKSVTSAFYSCERFTTSRDN